MLITFNCGKKVYRHQLHLTHLNHEEKAIFTKCLELRFIFYHETVGASNWCLKIKSKRENERKEVLEDVS